MPVRYANGPVDLVDLVLSITVLVMLGVNGGIGSVRSHSPACSVYFSVCRVLWES